MLGRDVTSIADLTPADVTGLLETAALLKQRRFDPRSPRPLDGRTVALIFQKPSLRTRVSFEIAVRELGGDSVHLGQSDIGLGSRETPGDVARTLDRWVAAIVIRTFDHAVVEKLAEVADVPVINALSDREHPCQALADLLALRERFGRLRGLTVAFVGESNNVFQSHALAAVGQGIEIRLAHPPGYGPDGPAQAAIRAAAARGGGRLTLGNDPRDAAAGADAVYTDTWSSMGDEDEAAARRAAFAPFHVDAALMRLAAPHAVAMHCLPAHRGEEIAGDVLDGPRSIAFDQAENRLHVQKALLLGLAAPARAAGDHVPRAVPVAVAR